MSQDELPEAPLSSGSAAERLARWLVQRAARRAPDSLAARLEEEWLADLGARARSASRLRFAIGCCWATRVIARELAIAVPVASSGLAGGLAVRPSEGLPSRRTATFLLVIGVHVALLYALITAVGTTVFRPKPILPIQVREVKEQRELAPMDLPRVAMTDKWTIVAKPPEFPPQQDAGAGTMQTEPYVAPPRPALLADPPRPVRLQGGPGSGFPDTEDYYPSASKRIGEQGLVQVEVCVGPDGRLSADPTLAQSSGFKRLDDGALRLAKAASGHYRPSTEDGHPVHSCYAYKIRFTMKG
jgi:TonB family protein